MLSIRRCATGFTLVELVVTIIILSVIGVVAYAKFPSFSGFTIPGYCASTKSALRRVQTQAMNDVATTSAYQVVVNSTNVQWRNSSLNLDNSNNCTGSKCSQLVRLSEEDINRGIRFSPNQFYFDSMGRYVSAATQSNQTVTITISAPQQSPQQVTLYQEGYIDGCN